MSETTTTPEIEALRRSQRKKRDRRDPAQVIDKAIYHLWETISDLEQIQPERVDHFRVSIFGSSRIARGDPTWAEVKQLSYELSRLGIDIVTGGGPGLMEAANAGAIDGQANSRSRSFGLAINLEAEEDTNPFVNRVYRHRTFFSRLHHFVRLSSAFVVMPGGIGTTLEAFMVWQLLQVRHMTDHQLIFVGDMWEGLIEWMRGSMSERGLVGSKDIDIVTVVRSGPEVVPILQKAYEEYKQGESDANRRGSYKRT